MFSFIPPFCFYFHMRTCEQRSYTGKQFLTVKNTFEDRKLAM